MTDLIERLRLRDNGDDVLFHLVREAADEIERLNRGIIEASNSLEAIDLTDNAAFRKLKSLLRPKGSS